MDKARSRTDPLDTIRIVRAWFSNRRTLRVISLAIMVNALLIGVASQEFTIIDDAWITFRYAYNLAYRGELVFNHGERIEGITNLLWAVVLGTVSRLSSMSVPITATAMASVLIVWTMYRLWHLGQVLGLHPLAATLPPVLLVLTADFIGTFTNGLEAPLYSSLLLEAIYRYSRGENSAAFAAAGVLFAARPEGIGIGLLLVSLAYLNRKVLSSEPRPTSYRVAVPLFFGAILSTTIFRLFYYGDFIPNSVRDKSFDVRSLPWNAAVDYVADFGRANPHLVIVAFAAVLHAGLWLREQPRIKSKTDLIILFSICCLTYSVIVAIRNGGDWMPDHRLLTQYGVVYSILLMLLLKRGAVGWPIAMAIVLMPLYQTSQLAFNRIQQRSTLRLASYDANWSFWSEAVERLTPVLRASDKISSEAIGYVSYKLRDTYVHDPIGLTDRHIAQHGVAAIPYGKTDIDYTLGTIRPAVLIWHSLWHIRQARPELLEEYTAFCYGACKSCIVMVRRDREHDLSVAFRGWGSFALKPLQTACP